MTGVLIRRGRDTRPVDRFVDFAHSASGTVRNKFLFFKPPIPRTLLWQSYQTNTICLFAICVSSLVKASSQLFAPLFYGIVQCYYSFECSLYAYNTNPLSDTWFVVFFLPVCGLCVFIPLIMSFKEHIWWSWIYQFFLLLFVSLCHI